MYFFVFSLNFFLVTEIMANEYILIHGDGFMKPVITAEVSHVEANQSDLVMSVQFSRTSVLFQYIVAPFMYFISGQQLSTSMFRLKLMTMYS